jgi:metal-dependent amidase/aminoacylase/carboxypeptidase family protein
LKNRPDSAKTTAKKIVDAHADALVDLSHRIHDPELCFEEETASAWLAGFLADGGLSLQTRIRPPHRVRRDPPAAAR